MIPLMIPLSAEMNSSSAFTPRSVSGLVTWINASNVITSGANITQMTDLSGNNNHAVQSVEANRPTLVNNVITNPSAIQPSGRHPVARFTSGKHFTFVENGLFPTGVTQIVVFRPDTAPTNNCLFSKTTGEDRSPFDGYIRGDHRYEWTYASAPSTDPLSTSVFNVLGASSTNNSHNYFINATANGVATGASFGGGDTGILRLGVRGAGGTNFIGDIAEALLFNRVLTDGEIVQISNFLMAEYAITRYTTPLSQFTNTNGTTLTSVGSDFTLTDGVTFSSLSYTFLSLLPVNGQAHSFSVTARQGTANTMTLRVIEDLDSNGNGTSFETIASQTFVLSDTYQKYSMDYVHNFNTRCRLQIVVGSHPIASEGTIQLLDNATFV